MAIGYKYNKRKVLSFVATATAGHTEPGKAYRARWIGPGGEQSNEGNAVQHGSWCHCWLYNAHGRRGQEKWTKISV